MQQFSNLKELLDFILEVSKRDYCDGFYIPNPCYDYEGQVHGYYMEKLIYDYKGHECSFDGLMVPLCSAVASFEYEGLFFRVCKGYEYPTRIGWAPKKETLFDQCWCTEIPETPENVLYMLNNLGIIKL